MDIVIIATGPLTSPASAEAIRMRTGEDALHFFDALAPIVHRARSIALHRWFQSRYDKARPGPDGAYSIIVLTRAHTTASSMRCSPERRRRSTNSKPSLDPAPIRRLPADQIMAETRRETLRHGPMKPFGLTDPIGRSQALCGSVQLRQDNRLGTLFNMVGFQTKLKHRRAGPHFPQHPGLGQRRIRAARRLHRNTYLNSPDAARRNAALRHMPQLRFAGQITA